MTITKNTKSLKKAYINFFEKTRTGKNIRIVTDLTLQEESIQIKVAQAELNNARLSVKDTMNLKDLGSPAAIQNKIKTLTINGWIYAVPTEDARRKQLKLTLKAYKYFERIDNLLINCKN